MVAWLVCTPAHGGCVLVACNLDEMQTWLPGSMLSVLDSQVQHGLFQAAYLQGEL